MSSPDGPDRAWTVAAAWAAVAVLAAWAALAAPAAAPVVAVAACLVIALLGLRQALNRRRLRELRTVARAYAAGDLGRRASITGDDSVGGLGRDLNDLGDRLAAARGELETQRRLLEDALGALSEGVACVDAVDRVIYANAAWRHLAAGGEVAAGAPYYEHVQAAGLAAAVSAAREQGLPLVDVEFEHRRRRLRGTVARTGGMLVLVLHDLTELKRLELARRDFVAAVSHELKTPLTAISGFAETLLDGAIDDGPATTRDLVGRIARHAERLTVLVRDVLTLSRLEQGAWEVHAAPLDLAELMRQIGDEHLGAAGERNLRLVVEAPDHLDAVGDRELLRQLVGNLVSNAVRYNRPGGSVWLRLAERGPERVAVTVQDTGIGIPAEHRERVFERFYRVDAHRSRQSGGTGLGLAIVKQLAENLEGTIDLQSGDGGTTFTVELPRRDPRAGQHPPAGAAPR